MATVTLAIAGRNIAVRAKTTVSVETKLEESLVGGKKGGADGSSSCSELSIRRAFSSFQRASNGAGCHVEDGSICDDEKPRAKV